MLDERYNLDGMGMKFIRSVSGVTRKDRWRDEEVRHRIGGRESMVIEWTRRF